MNDNSLLTATPAGLYCSVGDFYIDPTRRVPNAVITHAHSDHARQGMGRYLTTTDGLRVLRTRIGNSARIDTLPYGETLSINGVSLSLHPAGHVLGSAQVRVEYRGEVWVVTGDYKTSIDVSCRPFELVPCHTFITECTFGLPIYRWQPQHRIFDAINQWWRENAAQGITSVIFGYSLGKAQRLIANVDARIGPILTHQAVETVNRDYRASGIELPQTSCDIRSKSRKFLSRSLVVAPPSVQGTDWMQPLIPYAAAFASGWMLTRKSRRSRSFDKGFVLSDHVDWQELLDTISDTEAEQVYPMHGPAHIVSRWLNEHGCQAEPLPSAKQRSARSDQPPHRSPNIPATEEHEFTATEEP